MSQSRQEPLAEVCLLAVSERFSGHLATALLCKVGLLAATCFCGSSGEKSGLRGQRCVTAQGLLIPPWLIPTGNSFDAARLVRRAAALLSAYDRPPESLQYRSSSELRKRGVLSEHLQALNAHPKQHRTPCEKAATETSWILRRHALDPPEGFSLLLNSLRKQQSRIAVAA